MKLWHTFHPFYSPIAIVVISLATGLFFGAFPISGATPDATPAEASPDFIQTLPTLSTQTRFSQEEITVVESLAFDVSYVDDPELEIGTEIVEQMGENGSSTKTFLVTFYDGEEFSRELVREETVAPVEKRIRRGTKIVVRDLETPEGNLQYFRKLNVWATAYCRESAGGSGHTYTGTIARYGTVAVDPNVIPLGTKLYIPGYGIGIAEDIGGGVRGNMIDLFYEGDKGWWNAKRTDIYLLAD